MIYCPIQAAFPPHPPGESFFNLEDTLGRQSQILQALQALSRQMDQAERQWKQQLGSSLQVRPEGGWVSELPWATLDSTQGLERMVKV